MAELQYTAEVVRDLAVASMEPSLIEIDNAPNIRVVKTLNAGSTKYEVIDFAKHLSQPVRIKEKLDFHDATTFVDYINTFKTKHSRIFFDTDRLSFSALLDYSAPHGDPAWGDHVASLVLRHSEEWKLWFGRNGTYYGQREFGRFIEDNQDQIVTPGGTEVLGLVMAFTATKNIAFQEAHKLQNGQTELMWKEDIKTGSVTIPYKIAIRIPVFFNEEPEDVELFLRYQIDEQQKALKLAVEFCRQERLRQEAAQRIVAAVTAQTELPVHFGKRVTER